jgi:VWFA-related protein
MPQVSFMKFTLHSITIALCVFVSAQGQTTGLPSPMPQSSPRTPTRGDVVRITTNLVQVDVTIVDRNGQPVSDLTPADFEVTEDGKPQKITNLSFITPASLQPRPAVTVPAAKRAKGVAPEPPPPPVNLRPDQVRRAIALVVDDLGLSFESSHFVRRALKKFVDEEMQPGDLVAIVRTGAGIGALQQFTADKRMLYAAIERVRYNLNSRVFSAFAPIAEETRIAGKSINGMAGPSNGTNDTNESPGSQLIDSLMRIKTPGSQATQYRDDIFSVGTLGALNYIVRGLRELPGRKSVILFSDGFRLYDEDQGSRRILDSLHRLVDLANRASVVIYTVDPRGLQTLGLTAADNLAGPLAAGNSNFGGNNGDPLPGQWMRSIQTDLQARRSEFFATQQGMDYLAHQTGGFFVRNTNDLDGAVRRVLNNQKGYYLLGYRPDESTFNEQGKRRGFHDIAVKVRRPGLTVRTRAGFYGFTEEEAARPVYRTATDQLAAALGSPFASGDIRVRMSSVFGYDPERSSFTESILHIDSRDITFVRQPDGTYKASFQIMTATFGDNGSAVDEATRGYSIVVSEANLDRTYRSGLIYVVTLPVKKPGAYQLRMAVRDSESARVGSANQYIEVPDIKKKRLTLSGIILSASVPPSATAVTSTNVPSGGAINPASASSPPDSAAGASAPSATEGPKDHTLASQAIRRFQQRQVLSYGYYIYNARLDSSHRPQLETQVRLFRDGKLIYTGRAKPFDATGQSDLRQIAAGGEITLGTDLPLGEYVLQVIVVDKLAKSDTSLTTQWMDFDLVE